MSARLHAKYHNSLTLHLPCTMPPAPLIPAPCITPASHVNGRTPCPMHCAKLPVYTQAAPFPMHPPCPSHLKGVLQCFKLSAQPLVLVSQHCADITLNLKCERRQS